MSDEKAEQADDQVEGDDRVEDGDQAEDGDESGVSEDELAEIEAERERRLDPANRPEGAEVNNTDATLPTLEAWEAEQDNEASGGTSDPSTVFREQEFSEEERAAMAEERERRLDPDNRPEGAEVDNTGKKVVDGRFVDED